MEMDKDIIGRPDAPRDEMDKGVNPQETPGSSQPDTLAGTPSRLAGATPGSEPQSPARIPPYDGLGPAIPEGVAGSGANGTTAGLGRAGSTVNTAIGRSTEENRLVKQNDLISKKPSTSD